MTGRRTSCSWVCFWKVAVAVDKRFWFLQTFDRPKECSFKLHPRQDLHGLINPRVMVSLYVVLRGDCAFFGKPHKAAACSLSSTHCWNENRCSEVQRQSTHRVGGQCKGRFLGGLAHWTDKASFNCAQTHLSAMTWTIHPSERTRGAYATGLLLPCARRIVGSRGVERKNNRGTASEGRMSKQHTGKRIVPRCQCLIVRE